MIEADILERKLDEVREQLREIWLRRMAARLLVFVSVLALSLGLAAPWLGGKARSLALLMVLVLAVGAWLLRQRSRRLRWSAIEIARMIEHQYPELNALLLTAAESLESQERTVFQRRLLTEAMEQGAIQHWRSAVTAKPRQWATWQLALACLSCLVASLWMLRELPRMTGDSVVFESVVPPALPDTWLIEVKPGDVEIERGSRLMVEATVSPQLPKSAMLVYADAQGKELERLSMRTGVDEEFFGGLIARVEQDGFYWVETEEVVSPRQRIRTYTHPVHERVDVRITPPAYTKLPVKEMANTLKVTAMEGSELTFRIKVNKPVKDAELFGEDKTIIPLKPSSKDATLLTATLTATKTQRWRLHLVDDQERSNKNPPWISVHVQTNQLARIEVVFPKRDVQVSPIQELPVEARVWDDLGVLRSGASISIAGKVREVVFNSEPMKPTEKRVVRELINLEQEDTAPRQLVSYHFWAEDQGPKGEVRRSMSDLFFAEIRHFEDIFREAESPPPSPGEMSQPGQSDQLVDLQKKVVNATWRLMRDAQAGRSLEQMATDVGVVRQSQQMAIEQTKAAMEEASDAEFKAALTEAWKSMKDALDPLEQTEREHKRAALTQALSFEQAALEWLHRAQSREHRVTRQRNARQNSQGGQQAMQNQLMNLELKQEEQRYEEEKTAGEEQTAEQRENLQVLNRLKELARRQEALAEKMKELRQQMEQAKSEEEKQELASQLQRLQEEQEQLLRDVDDLQERMEQADNAANMADAREQLESTREQVRTAAEQLQQERLADATNAATRAQRNLEQLQEDFKQKTAKRFSEEMTQMRQQARAVAESQEKIAEALENQKTPEADGEVSAALEKMLDGSQVARQIERQQKQLNELLENMRRISEQAEGNNPLLHRRLYEAVREAQTSGLEEHLEDARAQSRYGSRAEAQDSERKAGNAVRQLQQNVEQAAESVLGSETEALRLARSELDQLIKEANQAAQGESSETAASQSDMPKNANAGEKRPEQEGTNPNVKSEQRENQLASSERSNADASSPAAGQNPSETQNPGDAESGRSGEGKRSDQASADSRMAQGGGATGGGNDRNRDRNASGGLFFDEPLEVEDRGPFTGSGYERWTDRLRNVEEMLSQPELRNEVARVLDHARALRMELQRNNETPQAGHLQMRITQPLVELRDRVAEELAKRDAKNPTVPVDRDPVPPAFRELVKRYYQELGDGK